MNRSMFRSCFHAPCRNFPCSGGPRRARSCLGPASRRACASRSCAWAAKECRSRRRRWRRIGEGNENAALFGKQLLGVPVRRRDDRLARTERVGQRAGGDLRFVEVGREVDVGGAYELLEFLERDEPVVKNDLFRDAERLDKRFEPVPVFFAFAASRLGCVAPSTI